MLMIKKLIYFIMEGELNLLYFLIPALGVWNSHPFLASLVWTKLFYSLWSLNFYLLTTCLVNH